MASKVLPGLGDLIHLLPTGTVFLYQFLSPVVSNYASATPTTSISPPFLLVGAVCLASFLRLLTVTLEMTGKLTMGFWQTRAFGPRPLPENRLGTWTRCPKSFRYLTLSMLFWRWLCLQLWCFWTQILSSASIRFLSPLRRLCSRCCLQLSVPLLACLYRCTLASGMELDTLQVGLHRTPTLVQKYRWRERN